MVIVLQEVPQAPRVPQPPQPPQAPPPPQPGEPITLQLPDPGQLPQRGPDFPVEAAAVAIAFLVVIALTAILWPIARAIGRRMDRKTFASRDDADLRARLERIEHAVDAVAIEVERISEGQRFTTKLLAEAGLADRVKLPAGGRSDRPS